MSRDKRKYKQSILQYKDIVVIKTDKINCTETKMVVPPCEFELSPSMLDNILKIVDDPEDERTDNNRVDVIDMVVEYQNIVEKVRKAQNIKDDEERMNEYKGIILQAINPSNCIFEEREVIDYAKEIRKSENDFLRGEYLPFISVIHPQYSYHKKILMIKAMILNLVRTLLQQIEEMKNYLSKKTKGIELW